MAQSDTPSAKMRSNLSPATVTPLKKKPASQKVAIAPKDAKTLEGLERDLHNIAADLWWSWNEIGRRPFAAIDPYTWEATGHNPLAVLARLDHSMFATRCQEPEFVGMIRAARDAQKIYHATEPWFERNAPAGSSTLHVAYFCSEFAIHESLQQYAGGLGVLAGDHMKSASDLGVPVTGIGLLYQRGYYLQQLRTDGSTRVIEPYWSTEQMPLTDEKLVIRVPLGNRKVRAKVWSMRIGRVRIILLDTDLKANKKRDRRLTEGLYKGEPALRLRQQVLLGVGGVIALRELKLKPTVYHLNEGHAAFASVTRLATLVDDGVSIEKAIEQVRGSTVFTTHTPVPAGHDRYDAEEVADLMEPLWKKAGLARRAFLEMGSENPNDPKATFCMTVLALRTAQFVNGVAALHGRVSREMWQGVFGAADAALVPIGHVTNGVHARTWLAPEAEAFWKKHIGLDLDRIETGEDPWKNVPNVDPAALWQLRNDLRNRLVHFIRERLLMQAMRRGDAPDPALRSLHAFDPAALTIGFARRFATYKRAPLIFRDADRLRRIVGDAKRPVQIVFAGKAHPRDKDGQAYAAQVHRWATESGFEGRIVLLEEYDMHVGRMLVSGCDVWLNNPLRPYEASGTSGMKPPMHGGVNLSILDGWWPEACDSTNGWAIGDGREGTDREEQDRIDAESLYGLLEKEVVPDFYDRDGGGVPQRWIQRCIRSAATIPSRFNSHRMVAEYLEKSYLPALESSKQK